MEHPGSDLLEQIKIAAAKCQGTMGNPAYFAEMFAETIASRGDEKRAVLLGLLEVVERTESMQTSRRADEMRRLADELKRAR